MFYILVQIFFIVLPVLINVAFITLFERKILGFSQSRKGPNKTFLMGIFQPFSDAVKLFLKELVVPVNSSFWLYCMSPLLGLILMLILFFSIPFKEEILQLGLSVMFFLLILSLNIYPLFFSGWSSNSKYGMIGAIRGISQAISYEISLSLIVLIVLLKYGGIFEFVDVSWYNSKSMMFLVYFPVLVLWVISCIAETNRTPFDFSEGESELVSGFNIEYSGSFFALLFMAEYGMIIFLSALTSCVFYSLSMSNFSSFILMLLLIYYWIWLRASFPRFRYDKLMSLGWKLILPVIIMMLFFYCGLLSFLV